MARTRRRDPWAEWDESIAADEARRRPRPFDARRALRAAGLEAGELGRGFAETGAAAADDLGGRLRTDSIGTVLVSAGAGLVGLILLDLALSDRGAGGVSRIFTAAGAGVRKLIDPYEPIIGPGSKGNATAAPSSSSSPDGPRREAPGDPSAPPPELSSFFAGGRLFAPLTTPPPSSSSYGVKDGPEGADTADGGNIHGGLDWFAPPGSPVFSPFDGEVVEARASSSSSGQVFGGTVKVRDARTGLVFVARHVSPGVQVGDTVRGGSPVARVFDWQGSSSDHAHIELWRSLTGGYVASNLLDPFLYLIPKGA